ncbi:hypothetical protein ACFFMR_14325 [Micromonospora andamanensis]|uniref:Uncharacterized protein n=1 Tax=Micromonospora andamanensis TaxID=1287068 RepID=A0ABQ4I300_9ACTN|nr:hypothetical protein [Micromonospora andamanensis]GIJ12237.1 hypothetical protein Van01_54510 [Micromonospora andamanensis]
MKQGRRLLVVLTQRWQDIIDPQQRERGDSPISTAIITAIIAGLAVTIAGLIVAAANGWVALIPQAGE